MSQCLCDPLLLHAEGCGTTGRSRVDRDGGITHVCALERLATEHPPWEWGSSGSSSLGGRELHVLSLGHTGKNVFWTDKDAKHSWFPVWSGFCPSFPTICFYCKGVHLLKRGRELWGLPRLEGLPLVPPECLTLTLTLVLPGQHSGAVRGIYREFRWGISEGDSGCCNSWPHSGRSWLSAWRCAVWTWPRCSCLQFSGGRPLGHALLAKEQYQLMWGLVWHSSGFR